MAEQLESEKTRESWRMVPIYFVSGSEQKARLLRREFDDVHLVLPSSTLSERKIFENFVADYEERIAHHLGLFDLFMTEGPQEVARGKILSVLNKETGIPNEAFVLATDVMPQFFPWHNEEGVELGNTERRAVSMDRPKNIEHARSLMKYVFQSIIREYIGFRLSWHNHEKDMVQRGKTKEEIENTLKIRLMGCLEVCVKIYTGIAIKFPNNSIVETFNEEVKAYPTVLYDIVDKKLGDEFPDHESINYEQFFLDIDYDLEQIIDQIITLQTESHTTNVSGGIDYSNPEIRRCLGAKILRGIDFVPEGEIDRGWFQGLPMDAIKQYIAYTSVG